MYKGKEMKISPHYYVGSGKLKQNRRIGCMICNVCGQVIPDGSAYCTVCGNAVSDAGAVHDNPVEEGCGNGTLPAQDNAGDTPQSTSLSSLSKLALVMAAMALILVVVTVCVVQKLKSPGGIKTSFNNTTGVEVSSDSKKEDDSKTEKREYYGYEIGAMSLSEIIDIMDGEFELVTINESEYKQDYCTSFDGMVVIYNKEKLPGYAFFLYADLQGDSESDREAAKQRIIDGQVRKIALIGLYDGICFDDRFRVGMHFTEAEGILNNYDVNDIVAVAVPRQEIVNKYGLNASIWYDSGTIEKEELYDADPASYMIVIVPEGN